MDCNPPGSSVHGILQARIMEWVAMPSPRGSSQLRDQTHVSYVSCIGRWVLYHSCHLFSSVQSLSHVPLLATPWTAAHQASLSITNSQSLLKLMSIESLMWSNHLILCRLLLLLPSIFPSIRIFSNESVLCIWWQRIGVSSSASVLLMNIQDWFTLGWIGWISLQSKGFSRVFSNT